MPNVRDDHDTPLYRDGMARLVEVIWVERKGKYFCKQDWTAQIRLIRFNKSRCGRSLAAVSSSVGSSIETQAAPAPRDEVSLNPHGDERGNAMNPTPAKLISGMRIPLACYPIFA